ncbi:hypothetical protein D3OALGA1CA_485 [Olavius algarvensis associated proteobacterium Delta 3]|nr:hypothetical protein D3OALGA1CA_485 [Olavius algarvensis associated proteobacterium Delta 3]
MASTGYRVITGFAALSKVGRFSGLPVCRSKALLAKRKLEIVIR